MGISQLLKPALFTLSPERAHEISILGLKSGLLPPAQKIKDPRLAVNLAGLEFPNPIGLAAGYDKNAEVPDAILRLGFGFTEVGTITPFAQPGNPKPRIFRLEEYEGVINRLGFNNDGHAAAIERLKQREGRGGIVGVNIGANKSSQDFVADYEKGIEAFHAYATYFTVNISSPNTPGLRNLQAAEALSVLLERVLAKASEVNAQQPVFLKIAPDLKLAEMDEIAGVVNASKLDGLIVSNTTLDRKQVDGHRNANEAGGLSGKPVFEKSTRALAQMRQRIDDQIPIIGVGGISSSEQAIAKLEAGANLLQLYSGLVYKGPYLAKDINEGLFEYLNKNDIDHITKIIGTKTQDWCMDAGEFE